MKTAKQHNSSLSETAIEIIDLALKYTSYVQADVADQDPDGIPQNLHDEICVQFEAYQDALEAMMEWVFENHPETSNEHGWDGYL